MALGRGVIFGICAIVLIVILIIIVPPAVVVPKQKATQALKAEQAAQSRNATRNAATSSATGIPTITRTSSATPSSTITPQNCGTTLEWAANTTAYAAADTDNLFSWWWRNVSTAPDIRLDAELFKRFGSRLTQARCGLRNSNNCQAPGCAEFVTNRDPAWAYDAQVSLVNLQEYFTVVFRGTELGQLDFEGRLDVLAQTYFPTKEQKYPVPIILAAFQMALSLVLAFLPAGNLLLVGMRVSQAGFGFSSTLLRDAPKRSIDYSQVYAVNDAIARTMQDYRNRTELLVDTLMAGNKDENNHTILDWVHDGAFIDSQKTPNLTSLETFFVGSLVSRTVNSVWTTRDPANKIYILKLSTDKPNDSDGPQVSRWYDGKGKSVYHLYRYKETKHLSGYQDAPMNLDGLVHNYSIPAAAITESSARAWLRSGFNFSDEDPLKMVGEVLTDPSKESPFISGPGWVGTWTIPVCDMGTNNWNTQYGV